MVEDSAFSHKIDYVEFFLEILILEGHQNCITCSRVTAILLNGWNFRGGGSAINQAIPFSFQRFGLNIPLCI